MNKIKKIIRLFHLVLKFLYIKIKHRTIVCLTVDFDFFKYNSIDNIIAYEWLKTYYRKLGAEGKLTYFFNDRFQEIINYKKIIREIIESGSRIEQHSHHEKDIFGGNYYKIKNNLASEKSTLEKACQAVKKDYKISCYRSGSLSRSKTLFKVLRELNYRYDASLSHHRKMNIYGYDVDDSNVPLNCYYVDSNSFKKKGTSGLIELPLWQPLPDLSLIKLNIPLKEPVIICTLIHPFNILDRGNWNHKWILFYQISNFILKKFLKIEYKTLPEALDIWKQYQKTYPDKPKL